MKTYVVRIFLNSRAINDETMERSELHLINFPYIELNILDDKTFQQRLSKITLQRVIAANVYAFLDSNIRLLDKVYEIKTYDHYEGTETENALFRILDYHYSFRNIKDGFEKWNADNQPFDITYIETKRVEESIIADFIYDKEANRIHTMVFNPFINSPKNIVNMEQYKNVVLEYMANSNAIAKDVLEDICVSIFRKGICYPTIHLTKKEKTSDYWDNYIEKELMYGK